MNPAAEPRLSVVLASNLPWEELYACLSRLAPQIVETATEVIVGDAHVDELPPHFEQEFPWVQWIRRPGASVFVLRNLGVLASRASIVAFTEDHCLVAPDWCRRILDAHAAQPEAAAIGGSVANGPTKYLIDWANYLIVFGPFLPPVQTGPTEIISLQANCSYKRSALPNTLLPLGLMEFHINRALLRSGRGLFADAGIMVEHIQSHGRWGTFAAHFHNGRSIASVRMESLSALGRALRIGSCFALPLHLFVYVARHVAPKPEFWTHYLATLPLIAALNVAHAVGEFCGYVAGPGNSMEAVR